MNGQPVIRIDISKAVGEAIGIILDERGLVLVPREVADAATAVVDSTDDRERAAAIERLEGAVERARGQGG